MLSRVSVPLQHAEPCVCPAARCALRLPSFALCLLAGVDGASPTLFPPVHVMMSWKVFTSELDEITLPQLSESGLNLATLARQRAATIHGVAPQNQLIRARGKDGSVIAEADVYNTAPDEVCGHKSLSKV